MIEELASYRKEWSDLRNEEVSNFEIAVNSKGMENAKTKQFAIRSLAMDWHASWSLFLSDLSNRHPH